MARTLAAVLDAGKRSPETRAFAEQCLGDIRETEELARALVAQLRGLTWMEDVSYEVTSPTRARVTSIVPQLPKLWDQKDPKDPTNIIRAMRDEILGKGPNEISRIKLQLTIKRSEEDWGYREGFGT